MEKLLMCRICLEKNGPMYEVVNKNLRELYEKLTDVPFVTDDMRPILVCLFCCVKLKQCFRLLRKCLEAEELFARMMNENYELDLLINPEFWSGLVTSPVECISVVDECHTERVAIKEELPAVCEGQYHIDIEEIQYDADVPDKEPANVDKNDPEVEGVPPGHADEGDALPVMQVSVKVEESVEECEDEQTAVATKLPDIEPANVDKNDPEVEGVPPGHADEGDALPVMQVSVKVEESVEECEDEQTAVATKRPRVTKSTKLAETNTADLIENERRNEYLKVFHATISRTSKPAEPLAISGTSFNEPSEKTYNCDVCQHSFNQKNDLVRHIQIHTSVETRTAKLKKNKRSNLKVFRTTRNRTSKPGTPYKKPDKRDQRIGEKTYECDVCQRSFNQKTDLDKHNRIHTGEETSTAKLKKIERTNLKVFRTTRNRTSKPGTPYKKPDKRDQRIDEKTYECDVCQRSFNQKNDLVRHIRVHTSVETSAAKLKKNERSNLKVFRTTRNRTSKPGTPSKKPEKRDQRIGEKTTYNCDVCQRSFNQKNDLDKHNRIHTGEETDTADLKKNERSNLKVSRLISNVTPKPGTSFAKPEKRDQRIGEKTYECDVCQRSFNQKNDLDKHNRIHTGEETDTADLKKNEQSNLKVSQLISNLTSKPGTPSKKPEKRDQRIGEKTTYNCDVCQRSFNQKNDLDKHNRIHTGEEIDTADLKKNEQSNLKVSRLISNVTPKPGTSFAKPEKRDQRIGEKTYECDVCQRSFNQKNDLDKHNRIHTGEETDTADLKKNEQSNLKVSRLISNLTSKPGTPSKKPEKRDQRIGEKTTYNCDVCQRSFNQKNDLFRHFQIHTNVETCTTELKTNEQSNLIKNPINRNPTPQLGTSYKNPDKCDQRVKKTYSCDVCQRSFNKMSRLKMHIRVHTGEKPYKCDICSRSFGQKRDLENHFRIHTGEKPYKCKFCPSCFSQFNELKYHIRTHTGEKPYKCEICQRSFSRNGELKIHIRIHTGEKPYKCDVCLRGFIRSSELKNHFRIHSGEKPYKCDICQLSFSRNSELRAHIRIHTNVKPYKCDVCKRSFSVKDSLTRHSRIHSAEKPFKCDVCNHSFNQNGELKNHIIRVHTGDKPHKCDVCQRSFIKKDALKKHSRIHTGEKPYKCDICQKSFSRKINLTSHMLIHTGEKPFKCDTCKQRFSRKINLTNHILIHTGEKPFMCEVCQCSFRLKRALKNHIKTHTNV